MPEIVFIEALTPADRDRCYSIRKEVFCGEQRVSPDIEFDGLDSLCRHYLAFRSADALGTARVRDLNDGTAKIERVAVRAAHRGRGIGRGLMERALTDARNDGFRAALLHAQAHAGPFYSRLGFVQQGDGFTEAGIPHIRMRLPL